MDEVEPGFELQAVSVRAGETVLLCDLDLAMPGAAWTAVLGPSGSGKSTLLRLLNRLCEPSAGRVCWRGKALPDYDVRALRREVALVVQQPRLGPGSVRDQLDTPRKLGAIDAETARARLPQACELAQLDQKLLERDAASISGGERQRVALARALMLAPRALLLDEPTAALDRHTARALISALERLRREQGVTVVAVTHRVEELAEIAARCVVLVSGRVCEQGTPAELIARPDSELARALHGSGSPAPA
jgi:ABC-type methionine transport system ATPase subunit